MTFLFIGLLIILNLKYLVIYFIYPYQLSQLFQFLRFGLIKRCCIVVSKRSKNKDIMRHFILSTYITITLIFTQVIIIHKKNILYRFNKWIVYYHSDKKKK